VRGPNSTIREVTQEGLQQLAAGRGMLRPPLQPTVAREIGATGDQQKMVGTPAQKVAALDIASGRTELARGEAREQPRRTATAGELKSVEMSENLSSLEHLGERVQGLVQSAVADMQMPTEAATEVPTEVDPLTRAYREGGALGLAQHLQDTGRDDLLLPDGSLNWETLSREMPGVAEQLKSDVAATQPESLPAADLMRDDPELAQAVTDLGISLEGKTVEQFLSEIDLLIDREFQEVEDLERIAEDPERSIEERREARRQLRQMGATGVRSAAQAAEQLQEDIGEADQIQIGEETYSLEEFLSNDVLSSITEQFIRDVENGVVTLDTETGEVKLTDDASSASRELVEFSPEFISNFVAPRYDSLQTMIEEFGEDIEDYNEIQRANSEIRTALGDEMLRAAGVGPDKLTTEKYAEAISGKPALEALRNPDKYPELSTAMLEVKQNYGDQPEILKALADIENEEELRNLLVKDNGRAFKTYLKTQEQKNRLKGANNLKEVYAILFDMDAKDVNLNELQQQLQDMRSAYYLGMLPGFGWRGKALGKLDDLGDMKSTMTRYLEAKYNPPTLADAAKTGKPSLPLDFKDLRDKYREARRDESETWRVFSSIVQDRAITPPELARFDLGTLQELNRKLERPEMQEPVSRRIRELIREKEEREKQKVIEEMAGTAVSAMRSMQPERSTASTIGIDVDKLRDAISGVKALPELYTDANKLLETLDQVHLLSRDPKNREFAEGVMGVIARSAEVGIRGKLYSPREMQELRGRLVGILPSDWMDRHIGGE